MYAVGQAPPPVSWHPRRMETMSLRRYRNEHGLQCSRIGTDDRVDAPRLQLLEELLGSVSGTAQRQRLRADLSCLNDFELQDIGISRGEIDYVASNRSIDPRGIRSTPPRHA